MNESFPDHIVDLRLGTQLKEKKKWVATERSHSMYVLYIQEVVTLFIE